MKLRAWLIALGITACASTEALVEPEPSPAQPIPPDDAGVSVDAASDGGSVEPNADAGVCGDCQYFPETCTADTLCSNGPFDSSTKGGSFDPRTRVNVVHGRSADDVWVAGALGALAHFDGTSWSRSDPGSRETITGVWLRESAELALGVPVPWSDLRVYARGAAAPEGSELSAGGWTVLQKSSPIFNTFEIRSAWAAPGASSLWIAIEEWAGGNTMNSGLLRLRAWDSTTFELGAGPGSRCQPACNRMNSVHGVTGDDVWAVGAAGTTIRITNAESDTPTTTLYDSRTWNSLNGVWAASDHEAWSVGAKGTVRRYTGKPREWDIVPDVPTGVDLNAVWGSSSADVWVVGDAGVVLHYDGTSWSRVKIAGLGAQRPKLTTVWGAGNGHVWVGGQGVLLSLGGKP